MCVIVCRDLSCLILNAGCFKPEHRVTDAGFEATFQINHLAQFYLVQLLLPTLIKSAYSRVITVSSMAHELVIIFSPIVYKAYNFLIYSQVTWRWQPETERHDVGDILTYT